MTTLEKLVEVDLGDVISMLLASVALAWITGGLNVGGVIGIIIGNRLCSLFLKD